MTLKPSARVRSLCTLALLAALVSALALAPRAEAFVYWTDYSGGAIGRANLDGTGVDKRFITGLGPLRSVAVDARHIYWAGYGEPWIGRARLDGTKVDRRFIRAAGAWERIEQVEVDDDHIYWATNFAHVFQSGSVGRAHLDGTGVDRYFISTGGSTVSGSAVSGIAVDASHIYWSKTGAPPHPSETQASIGRANLEGTGIEPGFIPFPSGSAPLAVEVDAAHVYWFNARTSVETIGRANVDGTGVEQNFIGGLGFQTNQLDLAMDAGYVYWADPFGGTIGRANLDGSGVGQSFITGAGAPAGVAVNFSVGQVKKVNEKGTARLTVEVPAPGELALAQTKKLKGAEVHAEAAGNVQLAIKPTGRAKKKLAKHGKVKVGVEVTYTPDGGEPEEQVATLRLKR